MYYHPRYKELREEIERSTDPYYKPDINEELRNITNSVISLESSTPPLKVVKDTFIKILTWIKNMVIKLYHYLKDKLLKWVKNKIFKHQIDRLLLLNKTKHLTNQEFTEIIRSYFSKVSLESVSSKDELLDYIGKSDNIQEMNKKMFEYEALHKGTKRTLSYLLDEQGRLRDVNKITSSVLSFIKYIRDTDYITLSRKYTGYPSEIHKNNITSPTLLFGFMFREMSGYSYNDQYSSDYIIDQNDFINNVKNIDKLFSSVESKVDSVKQEIIREHNDIAVVVNKLYDGNGHLSDPERYQYMIYQMEKLRLMLLCLDYPITFLMNFTRLVEYISSKVFSLDYITTVASSKDTLYHLSNNPNLPSVLRPRYPKTGATQYLPPRISFSPDPESAFFGLSNVREYFKQDIISNEVSGNNVDEVEMYLYQGLPDKDTRYLKNELLQNTIQHDELRLSEEIAVISPIKIRLVSKVIIRYYPGLSPYNYNRLISIEKVRK